MSTLINNNMKNKKLPENWCVKNDGSQLFKDTVIKYINDIKFHEASLFIYCGDDINMFYGVNHGLRDESSTGFGTVLPIDEFIDIAYPEMRGLNRSAD